MRKLLASLLFMLGMAMGVAAQDTPTTVTFTTPVQALTAPNRPGCVGFAYPLNCAFTDAAGNYARIYFQPNTSFSYIAIAPLPNNGIEGVIIAPITGYTLTIPTGSIFPTALTVTFQETFYDGDDEDTVTGSATFTLNFFRVGRWVAAKATLTSMMYSY
jgi:hypothetical protein